MPFRKDWKRLISEQGRANRRLYETAVLATLRDKLRSGDVWVEGSSNYRRFDSDLLPPAAVPAIAGELGLPATADEWLRTGGNIASIGQARHRPRPPAEMLRPPATARRAWLVRTSPLSWEHISLSGDFLWDRAAATAGKRRPLHLSQPQAAA
jgi:hypothetical protein